MCCRLGNKYHCLTFLSIIGFLQVLVAIPITVLSFLIFFQSSLGIILSPFWCGLLLLVTGVIAILIRPSRLAVVICFHVVLNATSIVACILAGGIAGVYGTAVHLPGFSELTIGSGMSQNSSTLCIFSESSELYPENVRNVFLPIEEFVPSCDDLDEYWTFLVSIMSLSFIGLLVSIVGILTNCITPCVEDQYEQVWRPKTPDV